MRTLKALACATALVAGVATSMAQSNVYSLNVVGYYNVTAPVGSYVMIANQLNTTNNTIGSLIAAPPAGSVFLKWNNGWSGATFDDVDGWLPNAAYTLNPGEAALYKAGAASTLTFVGEVMQGTLTTTLIAGTYLGRASIVPQAGLVSTDLGYPAESGDTVLKWNNGWGGATFDDVDGWLPTQPTFAVGEGMLVRKGLGNTITAWTRNFTVQ